MDGKYSNNPGWKEKYFFATGQWEFFPLEAVAGPRVPCETCFPSDHASKIPRLTEAELARVNKILAWALKNDDLMSYTKLITEVYEKPLEGAVSSIASGPPAANTWGATPYKPTVDKGKGKVTDKGKGKMVEPKKPEFQLRTSRALQILEPKKPKAPKKTNAPKKLKPLNSEPPVL
jgi:hypothetical protein